MDIMKTFDEIKQEMTPSDEQRNEAYGRFLRVMHLYSEESMKKRINKILFQFEINSSDDSVILPPGLGFGSDMNYILKVDDIRDILIRLRQLDFNFYQSYFTTDKIKNAQIMNVIVDYSKRYETTIVTNSTIFHGTYEEAHLTTGSEYFYQLKAVNEKKNILFGTVTALSLLMLSATFYINYKK